MTKKSQPQIVKPKKKPRFAFIGDTIGELRKVVWPSRQETLRLTVMVIIVCLIVGLFLGALDYGLAGLAKMLLGGR